MKKRLLKLGILIGLPIALFFGVSLLVAVCFIIALWAAVLLIIDIICGSELVDVDEFLQACEKELEL